MPSIADLCMLPLLPAVQMIAHVGSPELVRVLDYSKTVAEALRALPAALIQQARAESQMRFAVIDGGGAQ